MTRRHVTVALNGDGGDESFAGYTRYVANALAGRLDRLPRPAAPARRRAGGRLPDGGDDRSTRQPRAPARRAAARSTPPARYARYMSLFDAAAARARSTADEFAAADRRAGAPTT